METKNLDDEIVEVFTEKNFEQMIFMDTILEEYDKVYTVEHEGIKIQRTLEYMSSNVKIFQLQRNEKIILQVVKDKDDKTEYIYIKDPKLIGSFILNLVNRLEAMKR